ncbi:hypothetical protein GYB22_09605 [bacterium]|nr:hypothetical protein [bacterium]
MKSILPITCLLFILFAISCKDKVNEPDIPEVEISCYVSSIKDNASNLTFVRNEMGQVISAYGYSKRSITLEPTDFIQTYNFSYDTEGHIESIYGDDIELDFYEYNSTRPDSASMYVNSASMTILLYFKWEGDEVKELIYKQKNGPFLLKHNFTYTDGNIAKWQISSYNLNDDTWDDEGGIEVNEYDTMPNFAKNDLALKFMFFDAIALGNNNIESYTGSGFLINADITYNESDLMVDWEIRAEADTSTVLNKVEIAYECK